MGKQEVKTRHGERVAIVAGLRTPFARQSTEFSQVPAVDLGKMVVSEMLARTDIDPKLIEQVVFGQVVQMPEAPNIAREIVLGTGMHIHTDAYSVTRACATSFQAAVNVAESIMAGSIDVLGWWWLGWAWCVRGLLTCSNHSTLSSNLRRVV